MKAKAKRAAAIQTIASQFGSLAKRLNTKRGRGEITGRIVRSNIHSRFARVSMEIQAAIAKAYKDALATVPAQRPAR